MATFVFVGQDANNTTNANSLVVNDERPINFSIESGSDAFVGDDPNTGGDESADDVVSYTDYDGNVYTNVSFNVVYEGDANWGNGNSAAPPQYQSHIAIIEITSGPEAGQYYTLIIDNPPDPNAPNPHSGSQFGTFDNGNHRASPNEDGIFCFAEGTKIATPEGEVAIETLVVGDSVLTLDHGPQTIEWIGQTTIPAMGVNRPITIAVDTFGPGAPHTALSVSPAHRILIEGVTSELLFDCPQVLAHAQDLINDQTIRRAAAGGFIRYFHIMCATHEIIFANGVKAESFHPDQAENSPSTRDCLEELMRLFPNRFACAQPDPAARPTLSAVEARLFH